MASLAEDVRSAERIQGDRSSRIPSGYDSLILHLTGHIDQLANKLRLSSIVDRIEWTPGVAKLSVRSALTGSTEAFVCRRVMVTVPLGMTGAPIHWPEALTAMFLLERSERVDCWPSPSPILCICRGSNGLGRA